MTPDRPRVAVLGGGISGLAAAHRLQELLPQAELKLFEASDRLGGVLQTQQHGCYQVELGSDSFITNKPQALDLCRRIGLEEELVTTNDRFRKTFVVCRGRLVEVPAGFLLMSPNRIWPLVTTPILSLWGKLRLGWEYFVPPRRSPQPNWDETLASFVTRRLGQETFERLVQPLIGGIYTADAEKLSLRATLPRFLEMEAQHGGLIRASLKKRGDRDAKASTSGARYSLFVTPKNGLSSFIDRLAQTLSPQSVCLNAPVEGVCQGDHGRWQVQLADEVMGFFDAIIVALPAPRAAVLLGEVNPSLSQQLGQIAYAGAAVVTLAYDRAQIRHALDGFGFVVPEVENRQILACSFSSVKFPGRAPEEKALLRVFVGGAKHPEMLKLSDEQLQRLVQEELGDLLGVSGNPELGVVSRYDGKMPQYHLGHLELVEQIEKSAATLPGLELCGNAYRGVGIPDCIASGWQAAERACQAVSRLPIS